MVLLTGQNNVGYKGYYHATIVEVTSYAPAGVIASDHGKIQTGPYHHHHHQKFILKRVRLSSPRGTHSY